MFDESQVPDNGDQFRIYELIAQNQVLQEKKRRSKHVSIEYSNKKSKKQQSSNNKNESFAYTFNKRSGKSKGQSATSSQRHTVSRSKSKSNGSSSRSISHYKDKSEVKSPKFT